VAASSLIADARETARLLRIRRRLQREYRREPPRQRFGPFLLSLFQLLRFVYRWALPALACLIVFSLVQVPGFPDSWKWIWAALMALFQPVGRAGLRVFKISEFEALRMPSREGLLLHRWTNELPWLLWVGVSWSVVVAAKLQAIGVRPSLPGLALLAAVCLAPTLRAAWFGVDESEPIERMSKWSWAFMPLDHSRSWWVLIVLFTLHPADMLGWLAPWVSWLGPPFLALSVWALWAHLRLQGAVIRTKETKNSWWLDGERHEVSPSDGPSRTFKTLPAGPSPYLSRSGGLWRAQVYLFCMDFRARSWPWLSMTGYLLAVAAVWSAGDGTSGLLLPASAAFLASRFIAIDGIGSDGSVRLHLLGIDFRQQVLHNLKGLFLVAAPLLLAVSLCTGLALGFTEVRLAVIAAMLGFLLLRSGAWGLPGISETSVLPQLLALALFLALIFVPRCGFEGLLAVAATTGLVGLGGLLARVLRLDEARLQVLVRREAEGPLARR